MKKTILVAAMLMAMGTGSAMAAKGDQLAGGQVTFNGQVDPATCAATVSDSGKSSVNSDGVVTLSTVTLADMKEAPGVQDASTGLQPKDFSIFVDCSGADENLASVALYMGSADFANADGTLANNTNVTLGKSIKMANGVSIAVHELDDAGTLSLVNMINHSDDHNLGLDPTTHTGTYNLRASYVKSAGAEDTDVTSGAVTTSSVYSVVYN
jgi:P pilus assembly protein, pilin FimA